MQKSSWGDIRVDADWLFDKFEEKIANTNWDEAKKDVARFLKPRELSTLELWSKEFFLSRLDKLKQEYN
jgi:hypothetical protein